MSSTWKARSFQVMQQCYFANQHLPEKEILKLIDEAYPFGQRSMHPYKMWLAARKEFIAKHLKTLHKVKVTETTPLELEALR